MLIIYLGGLFVFVLVYALIRREIGKSWFVGVTGSW